VAGHVPADDGEGGAVNEDGDGAEAALGLVADEGEAVLRSVEALYPIALKFRRRISPKPADAQEYESVDCPLYREVHHEGIAA
jgi:hypothetical protein